MRDRFLELAADAEIDLDVALHVWNNAIQEGDPDHRQLIEELCELEIVRDAAGFGFRE